MKVTNYKLTDSSQDIGEDSKATQYWAENGIQLIAPKLRKGIKLPDGLRLNNVDLLVKQFKLRGVAFGNWLTMEDRVNYQIAAYIAFYDLNKVLKFGQNIGIRNNLGVCFGDRGIGGSLAHFNSGTMIININRYERGTGDKITRFLTSGGVHSFAHEYGHFLDFFAGGVLEPHKAQFSCTNGHSIARYRSLINTPIRKAFDDVLERLIWDKPGVELSRYYKELIANTTDTEGIGDYWIRRTEIFARAFESYISFELSEQGISNLFLTKQRYESWAYPNTKETKAIAPLFRALIAEIRKKI